MHVRDIFKILASSKKTPSKSNNKSKSKPSVVPTIDSKDVLQLAYKSKENIIQFPVKCDNPDDAIRLWNLAIQSPEDSFNRNQNDITLLYFVSSPIDGNWMPVNILI